MQGSSLQREMSKVPQEVIPSLSTIMDDMQHPDGGKWYFRGTDEPFIWGGDYDDRFNTQQIPPDDSTLTPLKLPKDLNKMFSESMIKKMQSLQSKTNDYMTKTNC